MDKYNATRHEGLGIWMRDTWLVKNLEGNFISRNGKVKVENFLDAHWVASLALEVRGSNILNLDTRGPTPQKAADALALLLLEVKSALGEF